MSNNYFIIDLLNIKDKNLNFSDRNYHNVIIGIFEFLVPSQYRRNIIFFAKFAVFTHVNKSKIL